jgi:hypothetical protein
VDSETPFFVAGANPQRSRETVADGELCDHLHHHISLREQHHPNRFFAGITSTGRRRLPREHQCQKIGCI